jgi:hypothetical protein
MQRHILTRRDFLRLSGVGLSATVLAACSSPAQPGGAPAATSGVVISNELHASDRALLSASGRPQLVEFFAFW